MTKLGGVMAVAMVTIACNSKPTGDGAAQAPPAFTPQVHANLAQMMRGIPFTFSNIVFDAQSEDPGAPKKPAEVGAGATSTFRNVYGGWQEVENSALALSESATLMMMPGRVCENGKPVPVDDEEYRKGAESLIAAGRAAYSAAQARNQDAILEVSDTVATACANCHEPYRDFDNPADRCTSKTKATVAE
jgi:hypothetical protein